MRLQDHLKCRWRCPILLQGHLLTTYGGLVDTRQVILYLYIVRWFLDLIKPNDNTDLSVILYCFVVLLELKFHIFTTPSPDLLKIFEVA
jgi:hypothetical protein